MRWAGNALHLEMSAQNLLSGVRGLPQVKQGVQKPRGHISEGISNPAPAPLAGHKLKAAQRGLEELAHNLCFRNQHQEPSHTLGKHPPSPWLAGKLGFLSRVGRQLW